MQQKRKVIILSCLLAGLIVVYIAGSIFAADNKFKKVYGVKLLAMIDPQDIQALEFDNDKEKTYLVKENGQWYVVISESRFPADKKKIENLIQQLESFETQRFVTENEKNYEELGLIRKNKGVKIFGTDERLLAEIWVAVDVQLQTEYVTTSTSTKVFETEPLLNFYITQNNSYWSDLSVFPAELMDDEISNISISAENLIINKDKPPVNENYSLVLYKNEEGRNIWELENDDSIKIKQNTVASLIAGVRGLRAESFAAGEDAVIPKDDNPIASIDINTGSNKKFVLQVFKQIEGDLFLCGISSAPYNYLIKNWALERVFKPLDDLSGL